MSGFVYEVWDTDTYNLIGAYTNQDRALEVAAKMSEDYDRRVKVTNTRKTKEQYNRDKKGVL